MCLNGSCWLRRIVQGYRVVLTAFVLVHLRHAGHFYHACHEGLHEGSHDLHTNGSAHGGNINVNVDPWHNSEIMSRFMCQH